MIQVWFFLSYWRQRQKVVVYGLTIAILVCSGRLYALTANAVGFEFHDQFYRVQITYTIPEIKEKRTAYLEFRNKKKAEDVYSKLLRGAEFYLGPSQNIEFLPNKTFPAPW